MDDVIKQMQQLQERFLELEKQMDADFEETDNLPIDAMVATFEEMLDVGFAIQQLSKYLPENKGKVN